MTDTEFSRFADSSQIQEVCYNLLDTVCQPIHETDQIASMQLVLNETACLTRFARPCAGDMTGLKPKFQTIIDWFVGMLRQYPDQTCETLTCYIQAVLTDVDIAPDAKTLQRYLDICAQYDAAMFRICNRSIVDFLEELANSKESKHRSNCVELIQRVLFINSRCEWQINQQEVSKIPREIKLLTILLQKIYDSNNDVALKAIKAFMRCSTEGNDLSKQLIKVSGRWLRARSGRLSRFSCRKL